jgi:hypothetical protein
MDPFLPIFGRVVILAPLDEWHDNQEIRELAIRWYNTDFDLVLATGHAEHHIRYVCWDHGGTYGKNIRNVLTNEWVDIPPTRKMIWLRDIWADAKYWTLTALRFVWRYIGEALFYALRPIKSVKFFRFLKEQGLDG